MAVYGVNKLDVYPITHVIHVLEYNLMVNLHTGLFLDLCFLCLSMLAYSFAP